MKDQEPILEVNNISKQYYKSSGRESFWALRDCSFSLIPGEILGIIGKNGAGKSTLLKILSDIVSPSEGEIRYKGMMVSILEIGTGFHPDLSGYDNIFLNASLLGMSKDEVKTKLDEIIAFSGLDEFIYEPIRNYSNGMYLRLAFSIAIHVEPQIILLDEVVAVGDAEFREKCNSKLRELVGRGMTIILVTHNMSQVLEFCNRCIWIEHGRIQCDDKPIEVIESYIGSISITPATNNDTFLFNIDKTFQEFVHLLSLEIKSIGSDTYWPLYTGLPIEVAISLNKQAARGPLELAIYLTNLDGNRIFLDSFALRSNYKRDVIVDGGSYRVSCIIPADLLARGIYHLSIIVSTDFNVLGRLENLASFKILPSTSNNGPDTIFNTMNTMISPRLNWQINKL